MSKRERPFDGEFVPAKRARLLPDGRGAEGLTREELCAATLESVEQLDDDDDSSQPSPLLSILCARSERAYVFGEAEILAFVLPWLQPHDEMTLATTCRLLRRFYYLHRERHVGEAFKQDAFLLRTLLGKKPKHQTLNALHGILPEERPLAHDVIAADYASGCMKYSSAAQGCAIRHQVSREEWEEEWARGIYMVLFTQAPAHVIKVAAEQDDDLRRYLITSHQHDVEHDDSVMEYILAGIALRDRVDVLPSIDLVMHLKCINLFFFFADKAARANAVNVFRYIFSRANAVRSMLDATHCSTMAETLAGNDKRLKDYRGDALALYLAVSGTDTIIRHDAFGIISVLHEKEVMGEENFKKLIVEESRDFNHQEWAVVAADFRTRRCFDYFAPLVGALRSDGFLNSELVCFNRCASFILRSGDWDWFSSAVKPELLKPELRSNQDLYCKWITETIKQNTSIAFLENLIAFFNADARKLFVRKCFQDVLMAIICKYRIYSDYNDDIVDYFERVETLLTSGPDDVLFLHGFCAYILSSDAVDKRDKARSSREKEHFLRLAAYLVKRQGLGDPRVTQPLVNIGIRNDDDELTLAILHRQLEETPPTDGSLRILDAFETYLRFQFARLLLVNKRDKIDIILAARQLESYGLRRWCRERGLRLPSADDDE